MKKQRLPATSTQVALTGDMIDATEKFIKRHWQCRPPGQDKTGKPISHPAEFEYVLIPPENKAVIMCKQCVHYPKTRIMFNEKDFEALKSFVNEHECKKGKKAFSVVSSDCSVGTGLSVYCMDCGETKELTDAGEW